MSDIGKGDWVRCIDVKSKPKKDPAAARRFAKRAALLTLGAVYQVDRIADNGIGLFLVGIHESAMTFEGRSHKGGFDPARFRKIWRGERSLIETLMQPLSEHVEPVDA